MLKISKKKLLWSKLLIFSGISFACTGIFFYPLIFLGALLSLSGAFMKDMLYRCPKCGNSLYPNGSRLNALFGSGCAEYCSKCGQKIELTIE